MLAVALVSLSSLLLELSEGEIVKDSAVMKASLGVLGNCLGGPSPKSPSQPAIRYRPFFSSMNNASNTLTPSTSFNTTRSPGLNKSLNDLSYNKTGGFRTAEQCLRTAWTCAQQNSAIMILTKLLHIREPPTDADALRELACRVLNGLSRHEPVRQILSKLSLINANELNILMQEPVLLGRRHEHARFCYQALCLIERVLQTKILHDPIPKDLTQEKILKAAVVAQTKVVYNQMELLQLMYQHLMDVGLKNTAHVLQQEVNLPSAPASRIPATTTSLPIFVSLLHSVGIIWKVIG